MRLLLLCFLFASVLAADHMPGETVFHEKAYFQYLGVESDGARLWLYPHTDGVPEIFVERDAGAWSGDLGSSYEPKSGRFSNLFNAGEAAGEFLYGGTGAAQRASLARLLSLFLAHYDHAQPPYYLRPHLNTIKDALTPESSAEVVQSAALHRARIARVSEPGTCLPALKAARSPTDKDEYLRRLTADGYLDMAVIGGNLYTEAWGTYNSWAFTEVFIARLKKQGFRAEPFRECDDAVRLTRVVRLLGQEIVVRVTATGGSMKPRRVMRGVANFTEGFARADVWLYHGHSNKIEGAYYVSENNDLFARFQIGWNDSRDLIEKLQGLHRREHQILAFQSCISLEKYAMPARARFEKDFKPSPGHEGLIATPDISMQRDFAPRFSAFVELLCEGRGARDLLLAMNDIRPENESKPQVFRGVLQPRASFVLPPGVTLKSFTDARQLGFLATLGTGSDGRTYLSSDLFAQNQPGDVVQMTELKEIVYALYKDGRVFAVHAASGGAMVECRATAGLRAKPLSMAVDTSSGRILLLCNDGRLRTFLPGDRSCGYDRVQPPRGADWKGIAYDAANRLVARAADGSWLAWNTSNQRFEKLSAEPEWSDAPPSLNAVGRPGELVIPH
jgi:hypothetical protein